MSNAYRQSSVAGQGAARARPVQRLAGPAGPLPPRRRDGARQRPGHQRPAVAENRRAERQAVSAGRLLVVSEFPEARMGERQGREPVSPRPLHLLVPHLPASEPGRLRRPDARGMHRRAAALEHAAAGAGAARTIRPMSRRPASSPSASCARAARTRRPDSAGPFAGRCRATPKPEERSCCSALFEKHLAEYAADKDAAAKLVSDRRMPGAEGHRRGRAGGVDVGGARDSEPARDDHAELKLIEPERKRRVRSTVATVRGSSTSREKANP